MRGAGGGRIGLGRSDELLRFRAQVDVGDEDVAALCDKGFGEAEVDPWRCNVSNSRLAVWGEGVSKETWASAGKLYRIQRPLRERSCP